MFTKKIVSLLVFTLVIFISAASETNAQETKTIKVDPTQKAVDTGVKLNSGDIVEITEIKGKVWVSGPGGGGGGVTYAGNQNTKPSTSYYHFPEATPHSLVAFVGDKKNHYQVRKNIFTEAKTSGNLFFAFNDGTPHYGDNKGSFDVTYRVIRKDKVCSPPTRDRVNIKWINKTGKPIRVNWINFKCQEEKSDRLIQPNGVFDGYSFVGHIFRVRDDKTNEDIGLITVESKVANFDIVK